MQKAVITTTKLCKTFSQGGAQQHVIRNLDLKIYEGDFTVIMGASGSGKSTLLYSLSGMDKPSLGHVDFAGEELTALSNDQLAVFRRKHCGFVFQSVHLLDNMSVLDNVMTAGLLMSRRKPTAAKAKELLLAVGIDEVTMKKLPSMLSGGEAQRVGVARAVINQPDVLFADEPTGALNSKAGESVLDLLTSINSKGQSVVMVTHDVRSALRGNRILYIRDGSVEGELKLPRFGEAGEHPSDSTRSDTLRRFLSEMGW